MEHNFLNIDGIPSLLWGPASDKLFVAVHGNQSNKADTVIRIVAETAIQKGYQVLSFDLPEHGDRKEEKTICNAQNCVADLEHVMNYAKTLSPNISLFGCSIGAYFSMLAYHDQPILQALFLSPVVDMTRLIRNMMAWFHVSEAQLEKEQAIATPINTLYWDYYQYVLHHPVRWNKPTALLYGEKDELCEYEIIKAYAEKHHANLTVLKDSAHFFHTEEQLDYLYKWLEDHISP